MSEDKKVYTMQDYIDDAIDSAKTDYLEYKTDNVEDCLHEIADSHVPIYYHDQIELAYNNRELIFDVPELGAAYNGENTPINLIVSNIYEALINGLYSWWGEEGEKLQEFINEGCPECGEEFKNIDIDKNVFKCSGSDCGLSFDKDGDQWRIDTELQYKESLGLD